MHSIEKASKYLPGPQPSPGTSFARHDKMKGKVDMGEICSGEAEYLAQVTQSDALIKR